MKLPGKNAIYLIFANHKNFHLLSLLLVKLVMVKLFKLCINRTNIPSKNLENLPLVTLSNEMVK